MQEEEGKGVIVQKIKCGGRGGDREEGVGRGERGEERREEDESGGEEEKGKMRGERGEG